MRLIYRIIITLTLLSVPVLGGAEVIYLKDGTQIKAAKVWEDNGFIKFSPEGYEGVVITYDRDIVERIGDKVINPPEAPAPAVPDATDTQPAEPVPEAPQPVEEKPQIVTKPPTASVPPEPFPPVSQPQRPSSAAPAIAKPADPPATQTPKSGAKQPAPAGTAAAPGPEISGENSPYAEYDGIRFYDPRRTYKYRTDKETWHRTLQEAIATLATTFDRPPEWIEQNIGNTNDLGQIYRNLQHARTRPAGKGRDAALQINGTPFYDPRRQYKYWSSESSKHRSLEDALEELAKQYDRSTDWIQEHIGDTNDLGQIHRNLERQKSEEDRRGKKMN